MPTKKAITAPVCGRLAQETDYGPGDVCGLPHGHEGNHKGRYNHLMWQDNPKGRGHKPIILPNPSPVHEMEGGGNIRRAPRRRRK